MASTSGASYEYLWWDSVVAKSALSSFLHLHCLCTGHRTEETPHFSLCMGYWTEETPHFSLCTGHRTEEMPHFSLCMGYWTEETPHFSLCTGHRTEETPHFKAKHAFRHPSSKPFRNWLHRGRGIPCLHLSVHWHCHYRSRAVGALCNICRKFEY